MITIQKSGAHRLFHHPVHLKSQGFLKRVDKTVLQNMLLRIINYPVYLIFISLFLTNKTWQLRLVRKCILLLIDWLAFNHLGLQVSTLKQLTSSSITLQSVTSSVTCINKMNLRLPCSYVHCWFTSDVTRSMFETSNNTLSNKWSTKVFGECAWGTPFQPFRVTKVETRNSSTLRKYLLLMTPG
jgi:hypothetical protein